MLFRGTFARIYSQPEKSILYQYIRLIKETEITYTYVSIQLLSN